MTINPLSSSASCVTPPPLQNKPVNSGSGGSTPMLAERVAMLNVKKLFLGNDESPLKAAKIIDTLLKQGPLHSSIISTIPTLRKQSQRLWELFEAYSITYDQQRQMHVENGTITQSEYEESIKTLEVEKEEMSKAKQQIDTILSKCPVVNSLVAIPVKISSSAGCVTPLQNKPVNSSSGGTEAALTTTIQSSAALPNQAENPLLTAMFQMLEAKRMFLEDDRSLLKEAQKIYKLLGQVPPAEIISIITAFKQLEEQLWESFSNHATIYCQCRQGSLKAGEITQPEYDEAMKTVGMEEKEMNEAKQQIDTILSKCLPTHGESEQRRYIRENIQKNIETFKGFRGIYETISGQQVPKSATPNNSKITQKELSELCSTTKAKVIPLAPVAEQFNSLVAAREKLTQSHKEKIASGVASLERLIKQIPETQQENARAALIAALNKGLSEDIPAMEKERDLADAEILRIKKEFTKAFPVLEVNKLIAAFENSLTMVDSLPAALLQQAYEYAKKDNPIILTSTVNSGSGGSEAAHTKIKQNLLSKQERNLISDTLQQKSVAKKVFFGGRR